MTYAARILVIAALAIVGAALGDARPAEAQLRIGIGAPLSGSDAVFGTQIRIGVEQAIADINASGGFLGQSASAVPGDDLGDPKRGADVAAAFARDKIPIVIGHFGSSVTLPTSAIYATAGVLDITPASTATAITRRGFSTIFRLCGRDDQQSLVATDFLLKHYQSVAILHDRTTGGKALADAVRKGLAAKGLKDVLYASLEKGDKDFGALIARLKASGARVAFWGGTQTEAGLLARQLHDAGAPIVLLGGSGIASDEFASLAGPGAEGTLMVFPMDPRQRPQAADLLRRLEANGTEPDAYTFYAYAAVEVVRQAADRAGTLEPADLAKAMHSGMPFSTVLGSIAFDEQGDVTTPDYGVTIWRKGPGGRVGPYDLPPS